MIETLQMEQERAAKRQMYDNLLDAFKYSDSSNWSTPVLEVATLGQAIRNKIDEHKKMIAALEWFASHISLDDPKDNALVGRIVLEGLRVLTDKHR